MVFGLSLSSCKLFYFTLEIYRCMNTSGVTNYSNHIYVIFLVLECTTTC